ncbi:hypothetical protein V6Z12_D13G048900 [Gossypium hirsutum]
MTIKVLACNNLAIERNKLLRQKNSRPSQVAIT